MRNTTEKKFVLKYIAQRLRYFTKLSTWPTFGAGWANRIATDIDYASEDI